MADVCPITLPRPARVHRRTAGTVAGIPRDRIEAAVDALLALLDAADGDPDLELDHDAEEEPAEAAAAPVTLDPALAWALTRRPAPVRRQGGAA